VNVFYVLLTKNETFKNFSFQGHGLPGPDDRNTKIVRKFREYLPVHTA